MLVAPDDRTAAVAQLGSVTPASDRWTGSYDNASTRSPPAVGPQWAVHAVSVGYVESTLERFEATTEVEQRDAAVERATRAW